MKKASVIITCMIMMMTLVSCAFVQDTDAWKETNISEELVHEKSETPDYAKEFAIDYYRDGYTLISISDKSRFLIVPENKKAPKDLDKDIVVLEESVEHIYLVASAVMDMFCSMDGLSHVRFSGTKEDGWYIEEATAAMQRGDILYAGKYSAPDYEMILSEQCELAIESTMIFHTPDVMEKLESFGIPVLVDYSSYETHPLGRCEWIKVYGALTGKQEEAEKAFEKQKEAFEKTLSKVKMQNKEEKSVAFFYINTNGAVNVRKSGDYVSKMIELAGGEYIFEHLGEDDDSASTSVTMQMEEFYATAREADYIIYNDTTVDEIQSKEVLVEKSALLKEFKAVQEGNVWCTTRNMYQSSMESGTIISEIYSILSGEAEDGELSFLYRLE